MLHERGLATAVGDEGGFAPDLPSNEAALETILEAVERAGFKAGRDVYLGLDVASSEFFQDGIYTLESENRKFTAAQFADYLEGLASRYPDPHDRGRHGGRRLGRLGAPDASGWASASSSWATICS